MTAKDITGQKFGRLTAIRITGRQGHHAVWECRCECGSVISAKGVNLRNGNTGSCGCASRDRIAVLRKTHGMTGTPEHKVWLGMINRCTQPSSKNYKRYGGRGIRVCEGWASSFANFYRDMGPRPDPQYSIERIDNDGNYEPANCRWATRLEQMQNTSRSRVVSIGNERHVVAEWARRVGLAESTICARLDRGMSAAAAVMTPKGGVA